MIEKKIGSPFENRLYASWTDFGGANNNQAVIKYSTNFGQSWGNAVNLSSSLNPGSHAQGVNVQTGPNGEVYVVFAIYDNWGTGVLGEDAVGFAKSTDGGVSFTKSRIYSAPNFGIRGNLKSTNIRVSSFPSMVVDNSGGPRNGYIYIVWAQRGVSPAGSDPDIVMIRSTNSGATWSSPIRVNNDQINNGKDQYYPWCTVDQSNGALHIVFYDNRNTTSDSSGVWMATSFDGGLTYENYQVSDANFKPKPISGLASGYQGDYIGITSSNNKVFPIWADDKTGNYQAWTAEVTISQTFNVLVDQKLIDTVSVDSVGLWNLNFNRFDKYNVPVGFTWNVNDTITLQGSQKLLTSQKYGYWKNNFQKDNEVANHKSVIFLTTTNSLISQFDLTYSGITIKNNLELSPTNGGEIKFKDPWLIDYADPLYGNTLRNRGMDALLKTRTSPFYPDYTTSYNDDVYKGVFLDQSGPPFWNPPYYSVAAISPQPVTLNGRTHNFYFQNWGGTSVDYQNANALETGVVFTNTNAVATANMKGTQLSSDPTTYTNSSQRKFVRANNVLVSAYESLGKVWIEFSRNGGQTWELGNAGKPLFNGDEAKNPALEFFNTTTSTSSILVVAQINHLGSSKLATSHCRLTPTMFLERTYQVVPWYDGAFSSNSYPSIAMTGTNWFMLSWVIHYPDGFSFLDFGVGEIVSETNLAFRGSQDFIYTDTHIKNISLYSTKPDQPQAQTELYPCWIAYEEKVSEQVSKIYTGRFDMDTNNYHLNTTGLNEVSRNSGFNKNIQPSILGLLDETSRLSWIGERGPDGNPNYSEGTEKTVVFTDPGTPNRFWTFGSRVTSTSINKTNDKYAIAWASGDNNVLAFADNSTLRPVGTINISGKDVQLSNGTTSNTMYALAFNTNAPPYYMQTGLVNFNQQQEIEPIEEREGIVSEEEAQVYFSVGNATVDNEQINFVEIPDTVSITSQQTANQYLVSEPFSLTDNSEFFYSVKYGLTDSLAALSMLSGNKSLSFKVELLDAVTNEVLGVFDEVTYDQGNLIPYEKVDYQVLTNGIGERTVKLRLVINSNFTPEHSVAKKYDTESGLAKKQYKQINYQGSLAVKEYALEQNYPNPFNPTTTINYQIKEDGLVTLKIFDILGSEIKTLVSEVKAQGRYSYNFNASDLASGVYIYQLRVNDFVASKKLMLLK